MRIFITAHPFTGNFFSKAFQNRSTAAPFAAVPMTRQGIFQLISRSHLVASFAAVAITMLLRDRGYFI